MVPKAYLDKPSSSSGASTPSAENLPCMFARASLIASQWLLQRPGLLLRVFRAYRAYHLDELAVDPYDQSSSLGEAGIVRL